MLNQNKRWRWAGLTALLLAGLLLAPGQSQAQEEDEGGNRVERWVNDKADDNQLKLGVNFGVGGFVGGVNDHVSNGGPAWGITATLAPDRALSYEAAYFGNSNAIDGTSSRLSHNQLQATVQLGPTLETGVSWKPFIFGGLGIALISAGGNDDGLGSALEFTLPVGVGADFFTDSTFRVGLRGQYNVAFLGGSVAADAGLPDTFSTTLTAQARF